MAAQTPDFSTAVDNIEAAYRLASKAELFGGLSWYTIALAECDSVAKDYGISLVQAVGVVAALSPQTGWDSNIPLARGCIVQYQNGLPITGHTGDALKKVRAILEAGPLASVDTIALLVWGAPKSKFKTVNFFFDILGLDGSHIHPAICGVTVDRWAVAVCVGRWLGTKEVPNLTESRYSLLASAYAEVARRHKMLPRQMQAITWETFRRIHGKKV